MGGKTMIGGTAYDQNPGKILVGGTAYNVNEGKTLVGGTAYPVSFKAPPIVIFKYGDSGLSYGMMVYTQNAQFNSGNIELYYSSGNSAYFVIGEPGNIGIDFTNYSTLHITARKSAKTTYSCLVGYGTDNTTYPVDSMFTQSQSVAQTTTDTEFTFDISALSGMYFIKGYQSYMGWLYVSSIYLD